MMVQDFLWGCVNIAKIYQNISILRRTIHFFLSVLLVAFLSSCATMFSGTKADIFIDGDVDEPVTISSSAGEYKNVTLPTVVEVKRHQLNGQHIQISSEHYSFDDIVLKKTFNEWALANAFVCVTPICMDLLTNAVSKPEYDQFFITPIDNLTKVDSLQKKESVRVASNIRARLRSQYLSAKYPRHELNGTIGFGPNQADHSTHRFVDDIVQPMHMEMEGECFDLFGDSYVVGKMEYHYRLSRKWDVGAMMAWGVSSENYTDEYYYLDERHKKEGQGTITTGYQICRSFSLAPSVRYTWYETRSYRLFSRVLLGMMRHHLVFNTEVWKYGSQKTSYSSLVSEDSIDKIKWRMAYQFSPIGISVGSANLRFFAELGYGCLGVVNTGICVCF